MKKITSLFISIFLLSLIGYSQLAVQNSNSSSLSLQQEECKSDILLQQQLANDPNFAQKIANYKILSKQIANQKQATVYTIPVVVHVIHLGEPEGTGSNISDAQIHSAINNLNQAYRNQAPYTGLDMELEFSLVSVDPLGNPTSGINRVNGAGTSDYATQGITNNSGSSMNEVAIKALSNWGNTDYYQFWIVAGIDGNMGGGGTQGYAYFSAPSNVDGAVVLYNSFGYDPTGTLCYNLKSYTNRNVTTIHEFGHSLGLYHTFQGDGTGNTCPTNNNCSTDGDEVCDTPPHKRSNSDCDVGGINSCTGGLKDLHIHNFMDYSSDPCQTEFTSGQKTKARAWLLAARPSLTTSTKLNPVAVPVSDFMAVCGSQSGCAGSSVNFFDLSEGNPTSWNWSFPGGTPSTSTAQYPSITYNTPGTYAVTLTATNSFGTGNTETKSGFITIYNSPAASCSPTSVNAPNNYGYAMSNVTFNTINNTTSTSANGGHIDFSCSQTTTVIANNVYNLSVTLNSAGSFTEDVDVYIDYNNDGSFSGGELIMSKSLANGSQTFTEPITIPLTAVTGTLLRMRARADANGTGAVCTQTFIGDVEDYGIYITGAGSPPVADFSGTPTTLCEGATVTYTDLSTNTPTGWSWSFPGGTPSTSTAQNPTITYVNAGTYNVTLTATNGFGSSAPEIKNGYITVNSCGNPPVADFSGTPTTLCEGATVTYTDLSTNTPTGWSWSFPGGTPSTSTAQNPTITYANAGTYNVTLTATNGFGSSAPEVKNGYITVNSCGNPPVADFSGTPTTLCEGATVTYTDLSTNTPTGWSWSFPGGTPSTSTAQNPTITYANAGTYNVTLTATNAFGNDGETKTGYITVNSCAVLPTTELHSTSCGQTLTNSYDITYAKPVTNASFYIFNVSNASLVYNHTKTAWAGGRAIRMDQFPGIQLNTTYDVKVKVVINGDTSLYGPVCQVTTAATFSPDPLPTSMLLNNQCGAIFNNMSDIMYAKPVSGATNYIFNISNSNLPFNYTKTAWAGGRAIRLNQITGIQVSTTYDVKVKVIINGDTSLYGTVCQITTPASFRLGEPYTDEEIINMVENEISLDATIYPNPNQGDFIYLELNGLQVNSELYVTDISGKVIQQQQIDTDYENYNGTIRFNEKLNSGFYFVTIVSGDQKITKKLVVR